MYKTRFYQSSSGRSAVYEFVSELDKKTRGKVYKFLEYLEVHGPHLVRPYSDRVRGKIRELRVKFAHSNVRILYFFFHDHEIILVHGFLKKSQALSNRDIDIAESRMNDWLMRFAKGDQNEDKEER